MESRSQISNLKSQIFRLRRKGFTLIELLIVMAVMGVLATITVVTFQGQTRKARDARRQSELKQYQVGLEMFANRNNGLYPVRAAATDMSASAFCETALGLANCPDDPIATQDYLYLSDGSQYVVWATLETTTGFAVACSNGISGTLPGAAAPSSSACPI